MHDLAADVDVQQFWIEHVIQVNLILGKDDNAARKGNRKEAPYPESPLDLIDVLFGKNLILRILPRVSRYVSLIACAEASVIELHRLRLRVDNGVHEIHYTKRPVFDICRQHRCHSFVVIRLIKSRVVRLSERLIIQGVETDRIKLLVVVVTDGQSLVQVRCQ